LLTEHQPGKPCTNRARGRASTMSGDDNRRRPQKKLIFDAERLRAAMVAANLTQEELARHAGVDVTTVRRAKKQGVTVETAKALGAVLDVPYTQLLADSAGNEAPEDDQPEASKLQESPLDYAQL
jgi:ribosome-binding protein aMBF1 (putative translation factor)